MVEDTKSRGVWQLQVLGVVMSHWCRLLGSTAPTSEWFLVALEGGDPQWLQGLLGSSTAGSGPVVRNMGRQQCCPELVVYTHLLLWLAAGGCVVAEASFRHLHSGVSQQVITEVGPGSDSGSLEAQRSWL